MPGAILWVLCRIRKQGLDSCSLLGRSTPDAGYEVCRVNLWVGFEELPLVRARSRICVECRI